MEITEELYYIKTNPNREDCLFIPFSEYEAIRNRILGSLLEFYDRLDYKDAGFTNPYLSICGYKCSHKFSHICTNMFYVPEWFHFNDQEFEANMKKQIDWCTWNYNRFLPVTGATSTQL